MFHYCPEPEPEIYANREIALQTPAKRDQYAGRAPGALTTIAEELCLSAARIKRFDTLGSHLSELERERKESQ